MTKETKREYFIIIKKGWVPEKYRVWDGDSVVDTARKLIGDNPDSEVIHVNIQPRDLWVSSAKELIQTHEAYQAMSDYFADVRKKNDELLSVIAGKFSEKYRRDIEKCMKDSEARDFISIEEKPKGQKQAENWGSFKYIYVNQTTDGGFTGDDFAGTVSIPLPDGTYLEFSYSM